MDKKLIDKLLSFNWIKTSVLVIFGLCLVVYASGESYMCRSLISDQIDACARLNFWPHVFVNAGFMIALSPIITMVYSLIKRMKKN